MSNYNEQFLKQNPLAILGILRDLHKASVPVRVSWGNGQFISHLLEVTPERLVLDFGSQARENHAVQRAEKIEFIAETRGARVEFAVDDLSAGEFAGLPAFTAPLPSQLWMIQRREYFRINAPAHPRFICQAQLPDGNALHCHLQDISLGGMGTLLEGALPETLEPGMLLNRVEVDLLEWGRFRVDAQLVAISERTVVDSKNDTVSTPRLSFRFVNVNPAVERELQRMIFALERSAMEKANRVR